ncbi:MAG TPA: YjdF family protein [Fibrobacteraceae bacterium]|nr:YjdF family protein [Fibrobacteraceae bacterium]
MGKAKTNETIGCSSILFDPPFYILLLERWHLGFYQACRLVLGVSEPTNSEFFLYINSIHFEKLPWTTAHQAPRPKAKTSYRTQKKEIQQENSKHRHVHTAAQLALKQHEEEIRKKVKSNTSKKKALREQEQFEIRQTKKRLRHKGKA